MCILFINHTRMSRPMAAVIGCNQPQCDYIQLQAIATSSLSRSLSFAQSFS